MAGVKTGAGSNIPPVTPGGGDAIRQARGLSIDLGCGANKAPGMIGVDLVAGEGVDHVVDLNSEPLPFEDDSVGYVFSSHTFEHLLTPTSILLREIPRVLCDRGRFELWIPRTFHSHAHVLGHTMLWNEEPFLHMTRKHRDHWTAATGVSWNLTQLVFVVDHDGFADATAAGFSPGFAIRYLNNIVTEFGVLGHVDKPGRLGEPAPALDVWYAGSRNPGDYRPLTSPVWW